MTDLGQIIEQLIYYFDVCEGDEIIMVLPNKKLETASFRSYPYSTKNGFPIKGEFILTSIGSSGMGQVRFYNQDEISLIPNKKIKE